MIFIVLDFKTTFLVFFWGLNILYLIAQVTKFFFCYLGINLKEDKEEEFFLTELPVYNILLPLYKENESVYNLINAIEKLDYPKKSLNSKLLVEEDDEQTLEILSIKPLPAYFEIIKIPVFYPNTKPKACNYGLQFARGKYVTIYDAEDRPEPDQLKKVLAKFAKVDDKVICIQVRLNFYNREENFITRTFSIKYSILFDFMMPVLKKLKMPIPLGGTSNHFIKEKLLELGA